MQQAQVQVQMQMQAQLLHLQLLLLPHLLLLLLLEHLLLLLLLDLLLLLLLPPCTWGFGARPLCGRCRSIGRRGTRERLHEQLAERLGVVLVFFFQDPTPRRPC